MESFFYVDRRPTTGFAWSRGSGPKWITVDAVC